MNRGTDRSIRVMVVEDSRTAAAALTRLLSGFDVVGIARTAAEALHMDAELRPDVITMDIMLPDADGLSLTRTILARRAVAIIVVSSAIDSGDAALAFEALGAGAYDVVRKDRVLTAKGDPVESNRLPLLVRAAALRSTRITAPVIPLEWMDRGTPPRPRPEGAPQRPTPLRKRACVADESVTPPPRRRGDEGAAVIAIGASTGGPAALRTILAALPANLTVPILVAQHMADGFTNVLVSWLGSQTPLAVRVAADREVPAPATVYFAPSGCHMLAARGRVLLQPRVGELSCPSVNLLLSSVGDAYGDRAVCVVLTGMGSDGADGLAHAARQGAVTAAQDRASSAIYGMPAEALRRGGAQEQLALNDIAAWLVRRAVPRHREDDRQSR